jgi:hypothetical protein
MSVKIISLLKHPAHQPSRVPNVLRPSLERREKSSQNAKDLYGSLLENSAVMPKAHSSICFCIRMEKSCSAVPR